MKNAIVFVLGALVGAGLVYMLCCKTTETMTETVAPKGLIKPAEAEVLDEAFNSRHQLISDSIVKQSDNRSSWYALKDVRDYLNYAEAEAKGLGYTMDGVRIYLGAHANTTNEVGLTTMFFIPTGIKNKAEGNMFNMMLQGGKGDVIGGSGLNAGTPGIPPGANYPQ